MYVSLVQTWTTFIFCYYGRRFKMITRRTIASSFSYAREIPVETLEILDTSRDFDYWSDIIHAGLNGRLDYDTDFNQAGYVATIRINDTMNENRKQKNVTHMTDDADDYSGVNMNYIKCVDNAYDNIDRKSVV